MFRWEEEDQSIRDFRKQYEAFGAGGNIDHLLEDDDDDDDDHGDDEQSDGDDQDLEVVFDEVDEEDDLVFDEVDEDEPNNPSYPTKKPSKPSVPLKPSKLSSSILPSKFSASSAILFSPIATKPPPPPKPMKKPSKPSVPLKPSKPSSSILPSKISPGATKPPPPPKPSSSSSGVHRIETEDSVKRSVFAEMSIMSELCALIYAVAYLVDIVGKGGYRDPGNSSWSSWLGSWMPWSWFKPKPPLTQLKLTESVLEQSPDDEHVVKCNLSAEKILDFVEANQDPLSLDPEITGKAKRGKIHPKTELLMRALKNIRPHEKGNFLWALDYKFEGSGFVYAITVNRDLKRVTVVFRGSVTRQDWWQNSQILMTPLKTPDLLREAGFSEPIKVHGGFKRYLLDDHIEKKNLSHSQMGKMPGYGRILRDLEACFNHEEGGNKVHRGFHLYITGHSLGGALSTLVAMKLASSWFIHNRVKPTLPVINVSVAAPYVGNEAFRNATRKMEDLGWLRHVRVTNQHDIVPVVPPKRFLFNALYEPYFHSGFHIHLGKRKTKALLHRGFDAAEPSFWSQLHFKSVSRHAVSDYWKREKKGKEHFGMSIEELYKTSQRFFEAMRKRVSASTPRSAKGAGKKKEE